MSVSNSIGGGRSSGFALIYDSLEEVKKFEARYRLARVYEVCSPYGLVRNPGA